MKNPLARVKSKVYLALSVFAILAPAIGSFGQSYTHPTYSYPVTARIEIDPVALGKCFYLATQEHSKTDLFDKSRTLCSAFKEGQTEEPKVWWTCTPEQLKSGFGDYLKGYNTRSLDFKTGIEPALRKWILEQPNNSITPVLLFETALMLSGGNAWLATLTIHQLVRNEVRWYKPQFYNYQSNYTLEKKFIDKLVDIRGDLIEVGGEGDHGGSWYRVWAAMLIRYHYVDPLIGEANASFVYDVAATFSAELAEHFGRFFHGQGDKGKLRVNVAGAMTANTVLDYSFGKNSPPITGMTREGCIDPSLYLRSVRPAGKSRD